jgi:hypothetical protein
MLGLAVYLHLVPNGPKTSLNNPQLSSFHLSAATAVYVVRDIVNAHISSFPFLFVPLQRRAFSMNRLVPCAGD